MGSFQLRSRVRFRIAPAVALGALALTAGLRVAHAEPNTSPVEKDQPSHQERDDARARYTEGREAYERGDYENAIEHFRASYSLVPAPGLLFNLAQALRLANRCREALDYYRRYDETGAERPSNFESVVAQAKQCDEAAANAAPAPTEPDLPVEPARDAPGVAKAAMPSVAPAPRAAVVPGASTVSASTSGDSAQWRKPVGIGCLAFSLGSAVAGTLMAVRAANAADRTSDLSDGRDGNFDENAQENESIGLTSANWARGLFAASAVSAAAGVWLVVTSSEGRSVGVGVGAGGGLSTTVRGTF